MGGQVEGSPDSRDPHRMHKASGEAIGIAGIADEDGTFIGVRLLGSATERWRPLIFQNQHHAGAQYALRAQMIARQ